MSILRNGHVALSNLRVKGHMYEHWRDVVYVRRRSDLGYVDVMSSYEYWCYVVFDY